MLATTHHEDTQYEGYFFTASSGVESVTESPRSAPHFMSKYDNVSALPWEGVFPTTSRTEHVHHCPPRRTTGRRLAGVAGARETPARSHTLGGSLWRLRFPRWSETVGESVVDSRSLHFRAHEAERPWLAFIRECASTRSNSNHHCRKSTL
jgi:hypothetical protein